MPLQMHCIKILRWLVGIIPIIGPLLVEYLPETTQNKSQTPINDNKLYELQGSINIKSHDIYITFPRPLNNNDYFFTLEPSSYLADIKEKTTTFIHLYFSIIPKKPMLKWFVKENIEK